MVDFESCRRRWQAEKQAGTLRVPGEPLKHVVPFSALRQELAVLAKLTRSGLPAELLQLLTVRGLADESGWVSRGLADERDRDDVFAQVDFLITEMGMSDRIACAVTACDVFVDATSFDAVVRSLGRGRKKWRQRQDAAQMSRS